MAKEYIVANETYPYHWKQIKPLFSVEHLRHKTLLQDDVTAGRGAAYFFKYDSHKLVLRHYRRGGLMAKISTDSYVWLGLALSRAKREFSLLTSMYERGLPVPQPFAARVIRNKKYYTNDLITFRLIDAVPLSVLSQNEHARWAEVGTLIRLFHDNNIYHADLNAHNIMLDSKQAYLIDFDKGKQCWGLFNFWKKNNVKRLRASLIKLQSKGDIIFNTDNWNDLLKAYNRAS